LELFNELGKRLAKVQALVAKGDVSEALVVAKAGAKREEEAQEISEGSGLAQMLLARTYLVNNQPKLAVDAAQTSLGICQELDELAWAGKAMLTVAEAHRQAENFEDAKSTLEEALEAFETAGDSHHGGVAATLLSSVLLRLGLSDEGVEMAQKGESMNESNQDKAQLAISWLSLSHAFAASENMSAAVTSAEHAVDAAQLAEERTCQANALCTLAEMHHKAGETEMALSAAKKMRNLCHEIKVYNGEACALLDIASIHISDQEVAA